MQITSGSRLGSYEIVDVLGSGGMGNVYRASDPRLGRDIAIKTLPPELARDPAALERFEREARFLAALNHPNIAAIYGVEEQGGERFLVLELVRGETLESILSRGALPLNRALHHAIDIASALEAAHDAGIVHRDLKPSNVKITPEGRVKLLDFGIAKSLTPPVAADATEKRDLTRAGSVIGTPNYMSPEQIAGAEVDRQSDVWSFGCLLYEMLTGRRAFNGKSFLDLADAIRHSEPDWNALPHNDRLRRLVVRCLKKHPRERLHDIADARVELDEIQASPRSRKPWLAVASIVIVAIAIAAMLVGRRPAPPPRSSLKLTQLTFAAGVEEFPAWSPDGKSIAYSGDVGGIRKIFVKHIGANDDQQITTGEFDDLQPTWSPDGNRILFVRAAEPHHQLQAGDVFSAYETQFGNVWAIDVRSRRESEFVKAAFAPMFSPDGHSIAVDAAWAGPHRIWIVDEHGYNPQQVTTESSEAVVHILPRWSPDGKTIVYQRVERTKFDIAAVDVATRRSIVLTNDSARKINPAWGRDARTIYYSSDRGGGMNVWRLTVDANGKPAGAPQQITTGAGQDIDVAVSPDGKRIAYATLSQNADIWRMPLAADGTAAAPPQPLIATTREDSRGAWSPDMQSIAFNSDRDGDMNIWIYSLRDRTTRQVTHGSGGDFQPNWSSDGQHLVFFSSRSGDLNIWRVDADGRNLIQLTRGHSVDINPFFSPDGNQIVYQSDATGRLELWVMHSDGSQRRQLTTVGVSGHFERWLPDGFIYFRSPSTGGMMRVGATGGEGQPVSKNAGAHISFSPDRSKFIDVANHKVLWLYSLDGAKQQLFVFSEPDVRIDYPVWSPDGKWLLFDRFKPEGGDLWMAEGFE